MLKDDLKIYNNPVENKIGFLSILILFIFLIALVSIQFPIKNMASSDSYIGQIKKENSITGYTILEEDFINDSKYDKCIDNLNKIERVYVLFIKESKKQEITNNFMKFGFDKFEYPNNTTIIAIGYLINKKETCIYLIDNNLIFSIERPT